MLTTTQITGLCIVFLCMIALVLIETSSKRKNQ